MEKAKLISVLLVVLMVGCAKKSRDNNFTVEVSGTPGVGFDGTCMVEVSDGWYILDIEEKVPYTLKHSCRFIRCVFQKGNNLEDFELKMYADGVFVHEHYDNSRFGVIDTRRDENVREIQIE